LNPVFDRPQRLEAPSAQSAKLLCGQGPPTTYAEGDFEHGEAPAIEQWDRSRNGDYDGLYDGLREQGGLGEARSLGGTHSDRRTRP
jgi:hypothetical protein